MSGNTNIVVSCLHGYCVITLILCEKIRKEGKKERRKERKKERKKKKERKGKTSAITSSSSFHCPPAAAGIAFFSSKIMALSSTFDLCRASSCRWMAARPSLFGSAVVLVASGVVTPTVSLTFFWA